MYISAVHLFYLGRCTIFKDTRECCTSATRMKEQNGHEQNKWNDIAYTDLCAHGLNNDRSSSHYKWL